MFAETVQQAVAAGRETLLNLQYPDGQWQGVVRCDPGVTAQYVLMARYMDRLDPAADGRLLAHLDRSQLPDGGWAAYPGGPPSLDVSLLCYAALRFAGRSPDARQCARSEFWHFTPLPDGTGAGPGVWRVVGGVVLRLLDL
ncbi:MAG: hypothetical protein ACRDFT_03655 [bacterium]